MTNQCTASDDALGPAKVRFEVTMVGGDLQLLSPGYGRGAMQSVAPPHPSLWFHSRFSPFASRGESASDWADSVYEPEPRMPRTHRLLRYITSSILFLCVILFSLASHAETQVVETPEGSVEFIGLERWTVESLLDSLSVRSQRITPSQYPSALRELGFPRAAVDRIRPSGLPGGPSRSPAWISLVTLVEPHRSDVVSLRGGLGSDDPLPASWLEADSLFRQHNPDFLVAVGLRLLRNADGQPPPALTENLGPSRQSIVERAWTALEDLRSAGNLSDALTILQRDRGRATERWQRLCWPGSQRNRRRGEDSSLPFVIQAQA